VQCLPLLDRYRIEGVLVSPKNDIKLFRCLWGSGDWSLVYWDDACLCYVRRSGPNACWAAPLAYTAVDPERSPYFDPARPDLALNELRRAQAAAPRSFLPYFFAGDLELRLGQFPAARLDLTQALRLAPLHAASHLSLGLVDLQTGLAAPAEAEFREVLRIQDDPNLTAMASFYLASTLAADPRRRAEAARWAARAVALLPNWPQAQNLARTLSR
jgi:tetratricopeptide (TPR) repeat protein